MRGDALEHFVAPDVCEVDVVEIDLATHRRERPSAGRVAYFDRQVEDLEDAPSADHRFVEIAYVVRDLIHRIAGDDREREEAGPRLDRQMADDDFVERVAGEDRNADGHDEVDDR